MALQLHRGQATNFGTTIIVSFVVLAFIAQPLILLNQKANAATVVQVSQNSTDWVAGDTRPGGSAAFSDSFGAPAGFGTNALKISTTDGSAKAQKVHILPESVPLSNINDISYWAYRSSGSTGSAVQVAALNLVLDYNGPAAGGFTTLVLEPVYQTHQAALLNNTWQKWNGGNDDIWWSSNPIPGAPNRDTFVTLQTIKDNNPDATVSAYGFNQGSGNPGITSAVDGLTINDTTYNFEAEPPATPTNLRLNDDKPCGYATNVNWITPTWGAVAGAASYNYKVTLPNGSTYGPTNVGNVTSVSGAFGGEGLSTFAVQAVDGSGLTSEWSSPCAVTYDKTVPTTPTNGQPRDGAYKTTNDFYFTWDPSTDAGVAGITYEFQSSGSNSTDANGSLVGAWNSIANGNSEQNNLPTPQIHSTGAPDGHYYWQVRAIDLAGNKSAWSTVWDMRIDQKPTAPVFSVDGHSSGDVTNSYSITARWTKPSADTVKYEYQYWNNIAGNQYKEDTPYSVEVTSESTSGVFNQGEGVHYMRVRAIDAIGTPSDWSNVVAITYDASAPVVTLNDIAPVNEGESPLVSGTVADLSVSGVDIFVNGNLVGTTSVQDGAYSSAITGLANGTYTITVVARDAAGNAPTTSQVKTATVHKVDVADPEGPANQTYTAGSTDNGEVPPVNETSTSENSTDGNLFFQAPLVAVEDQFVLGAEDASTNQQAATKFAVSDGKDVKGMSDVKTGGGVFNPLGFAWYWWLLLVAIIGGGAWWLVAGRKRHGEDA